MFFLSLFYKMSLLWAKIFDHLSLTESVDGKDGNKPFDIEKNRIS